MDQIERIADFNNYADEAKRIISHGVKEEATVSVGFCDYDGGEDEWGNPLGEPLNYCATVETSLLVQLPRASADYQSHDGWLKDENGSMMVVLDGNYPGGVFISANKTDVLRAALDFAYARSHDYVIMSCEDDDTGGRHQITLTPTPEREQMRAAFMARRPEPSPTGSRSRVLPPPQFV